MTALLGFMALALDVGVIFRARRNLQIAADAAATAGALDLYQSMSYSNGAALLLAANTEVGTEPVNFAVLQSPPTDGPNTGKPGYVEVVLSQRKPTLFMNMFSRSGMTIAARAVAGSPTFNTNCAYLDDAHMSNALALKGQGSISATHCGIYVNSDAIDAVYSNGASSVDASALLVHGNDTSALSLDPGRTYINVAPQTPPIPLNLPNPAPTCTASVSAGEITLSTTTGNSKIQQSTINGYIDPNSSSNVICFTNPVSIDSGVALNGLPGNGVMYVFQKGLSLPNGKVSFGKADGPDPVTGQFSNTFGAVLDLAGGNLSQSNGALSIYAPTSGPYNSIALMVPMANSPSSAGVHCPSSPVSPCLLIQRGDTGAVFDGIIYAPGMYVELQDNAGGVYATGIIARGLFNKTSSLVLRGYSQSNQYSTPFRVVTLVE
jgi:hypothetical protein